MSVKDILIKMEVFQQRQLAINKQQMELKNEIQQFQMDNLGVADGQPLSVESLVRLVEKVSGMKTGRKVK